MTLQPHTVDCIFGTVLAMALIIASIFWLASRRLGFMTRNAVASGLAFGVCVYLVMNFVVIPLSAFPTQMTYTPVRVAINVVAS